ncbi:hypothetical protein JW979_15735, partial [bacterium]|nr:hypothetical protein [candidate division CSSED10-310 bacterium]
MKHLILGFLAILTVSVPVSAVTVTLQFAETEIFLNPNGNGIVEYVVRFNVVEGAFHGFYFEGFDRLTPYFDRENAFAIDDRDNQYSLNIKKMKKGTYDIYLAEDAAVHEGWVTFRFRFAADFNQAGYLVPTVADDGRQLVVLNWSPTQFDMPMDHYTVMITYPIEYSDYNKNRDSIHYALLSHNFATEKWMNEKYLIDYRLKSYEGKDYITVVLHKNNPPANFHFRIQQYIDAKTFSFDTDREFVSGPAENKTRERSFLSAAFMLLISFVMPVVFRKHRTMVKAMDHLDDIKWSREDWEPPKIELASYRKPGKIAKDLEPVEAALFIGVPYKQILSTMLSQLIDWKFLNLISRDPLKVDTVSPPPSPLDTLGNYERMLFIAASDDGMFDTKELEELLKQMVDGVQKKAWDCDIDATRSYYSDQIAEAFHH